MHCSSELQHELLWSLQKGLQAQRPKLEVDSSSETVLSMRLPGTVLLQLSLLCSMVFIVMFHNCTFYLKQVLIHFKKMAFLSHQKRKVMDKWILSKKENRNASSFIFQCRELVILSKIDRTRKIIETEFFIVTNLRKMNWK